MSNTLYPPPQGEQYKPPTDQPGQGQPPPIYNNYNYASPPPGQPNHPDNNRYFPPYSYEPPLVTANVGFWSRAVALFIDSLIVGIPTGLFYGFLNLIFRPFWNDWSGVGFSSHYPFGWTTSIIFWGLYAWLCYTYLNGNTLGKTVMGLKLINPDGSKPTMSTFILHYSIGYWLNGLVICLGYLWAVFDPYHQTWGQKLFKDLTVRGQW